MLRIAALNESDSGEEEQEQQDGQTTTREAEEAEAFSVYNRALGLQRGGDSAGAEELLSGLLQHPFLLQARQLVEGDEEDTHHAGLPLLYLVHKNLAAMAIARGDLVEGMKYYLEAVKIDASEVTVWYKMGIIAKKLHNYPLAKLAFEQGLQCNENHWPCLDSVITVLYALNDYWMCLDYIGRALERDCHYTKGLVFYRQILKEQSSLAAETKAMFAYCDPVIHTIQVEKSEAEEFIQEAVKIREVRRELAKKPPSPPLKLPKPITELTWKCVGQCFVELFDTFVASDPPKSLVQSLDLSEYREMAGLGTDKTETTSTSTASSADAKPLDAKTESPTIGAGDAEVKNEIAVETRTAKETGEAKSDEKMKGEEPMEVGGDEKASVSAEGNTAKAKAEKKDEAKDSEQLSVSLLKEAKRKDEQNLLSDKPQDTQNIVESKPTDTQASDAKPGLSTSPNTGTEASSNVATAETKQVTETKDSSTKDSSSSDSSRGSVSTSTRETSGSSGSPSLSGTPQSGVSPGGSNASDAAAGTGLAPAAASADVIGSTSLPVQATLDTTAPTTLLIPVTSAAHRVSMAPTDSPKPTATHEGDHSYTSDHPVVTRHDPSETSSMAVTVSSGCVTSTTSTLTTAITDLTVVSDSEAKAETVPGLATSLAPVTKTDVLTIDTAGASMFLASKTETDALASVSVSDAKENLATSISGDSGTAQTSVQKPSTSSPKSRVSEGNPTPILSALMASVPLQTLSSPLPPIQIPLPADYKGAQPAAHSLSPAARSPVARSSSPVVRSGSPLARSSSPVVRSGSPLARSASPAARSGSPIARSASPAAAAASLAQNQPSPPRPTATTTTTATSLHARSTPSPSLPKFQFSTMTPRQVQALLQDPLPSNPLLSTPAPSSYSPNMAERLKQMTSLNQPPASSPSTTASAQLQSLARMATLTNSQPVADQPGVTSADQAAEQSNGAQLSASTKKSPQSQATPVSAEVALQDHPGPGKASRRVSKRKRNTIEDYTCISIEDGVKRRSARVRNTRKEEENVDFQKLLKNFLPSTLTVTVPLEEDTQQSQTQDTMSASVSQIQLDTTLSGMCSEPPLSETETEDVRQYLAECMNGQGVIGLMYKYLVHLSTRDNRLWPAGVPQLYCMVYERLHPHLTFPSLICKNFPDICYKEMAKMALVWCELALDTYLAKKAESMSPAMVQRVTEEMPVVDSPFTKDSGVADLYFISGMVETGHVDLLEDQASEFTIRVYWSIARLAMADGVMEKAVENLDTVSYCLQQEEESKTFCLPNCTQDRVISLDEVKRQQESLQRCQSLEETQRLFDSGQYQAVVDNLVPTFSQSQAAQSRMKRTLPDPERHTQLEFLMDALFRLQDFGQCLVWGEVALNEALHHYLRAPTIPLRNNWAVTLTRLFQALKRVLDIKAEAVSALTQRMSVRFVQSLMRVIEINHDVADTVTEMPVNTVLPWIILYRVIKHEEDKLNALKLPGAENEEEMEGTISSSLMLLSVAHEYLGRHAWCMINKGMFLLFYMEVLSKELPKADDSVREDLETAFEQCVYCLYSHPNKKGRAKHLTDHSATPIELTWEKCEIVFEYFRPKSLPEFDSYKTSTVGAELEHLLRRIYNLIPEAVGPGKRVDQVQEYIEGTTSVAPNFSTDNLILQELYYLLADYHFKKEEPPKAIKFYTYDICFNSWRFDSWAGLALAKNYQMEQKLNSMELKIDAPIHKKSIAALRCFSRAVEIDESVRKLWIEYGALAYQLHSHASRQLRMQFWFPLTPELLEIAQQTRVEMLATARNCYWKASECEAEGSEEEWLHHYMMGKVMEKKRAHPRLYLEHYKQAAIYIHEEEAKYPRKINYQHSPPHLALEALEMYYRLHVAVMKHLLRISTPETKDDMALFDRYLTEATESPFALRKEKRVEMHESLSSADDVESQSSAMSIPPYSTAHQKPVYHMTPQDHTYSKQKSSGGEMSDTSFSAKGETLTETDGSQSVEEMDTLTASELQSQESADDDQSTATAKTLKEGDAVKRESSTGERGASEAVKAEEVRGAGKDGKKAERKKNEMGEGVVELHAEMDSQVSGEFVDTKPLLFDKQISGGFEPNVGSRADLSALVKRDSDGHPSGEGDKVSQRTGEANDITAQQKPPKDAEKGQSEAESVVETSMEVDSQDESAAESTDLQAEKSGRDLVTPGAPFAQLIGGSCGAELVKSGSSTMKSGVQMQTPTDMEVTTQNVESKTSKDAAAKNQMGKDQSGTTPVAVSTPKKADGKAVPPFDSPASLQGVNVNTKDSTKSLQKSGSQAKAASETVTHRISSKQTKTTPETILSEADQSKSTLVISLSSVELGSLSQEEEEEDPSVICISESDDANDAGAQGRTLPQKRLHSEEDEPSKRARVETGEKTTEELGGGEKRRGEEGVKTGGKEAKTLGTRTSFAGESEADGNKSYVPKSEYTGSLLQTAPKGNSLKEGTCVSKPKDGTSTGDSFQPVDVDTPEENKDKKGKVSTKTKEREKEMMSSSESSLSSDSEASGSKDSFEIKSESSDDEIVLTLPVGEMLGASEADSMSQDDDEKSADSVEITMFEQFKSEKTDGKDTGGSAVREKLPATAETPVSVSESDREKLVVSEKSQTQTKENWQVEKQSGVPQDAEKPDTAKQTSPEKVSTDDVAQKEGEKTVESGALSKDTTADQTPSKDAADEKEKAASPNQDEKKNTEEQTADSKEKAASPSHEEKRNAAEKKSDEAEKATSLNQKEEKNAEKQTADSKEKGANEFPSESKGRTADAGTDSSATAQHSGATTAEPDKPSPPLCEQEYRAWKVRLLDKCVAGLHTCLSRFPTHYKSLYRLAYLYYMSDTHRNLEFAKDLLLGNSDWQKLDHMPCNGLFADRKANNFFQGTWKIPIEEIDRSGSFASHINRSVQLLLDVLRDEGDVRMLLTIHSQLRKKPDIGRKYLRDAERPVLARMAHIYVLDAVARQLEQSGPEVDKTEVLLNAYRAYNAHRSGTDARRAMMLLIAAYQRLGLPQLGYGSPVEQAVNYCANLMASLAQNLTPRADRTRTFSSSSVQATTPTETPSGLRTQATETLSTGVGTSSHPSPYGPQASLAETTPFPSRGTPLPSSNTSTPSGGTPLPSSGIRLPSSGLPTSVGRPEDARRMSENDRRMPDNRGLFSQSATGPYIPQPIRSSAGNSLISSGIQHTGTTMTPSDRQQMRHTPSNVTPNSRQMLMGHTPTSVPPTGRQQMGGPSPAHSHLSPKGGNNRGGAAPPAPAHTSPVNSSHAKPSAPGALDLSSPKKQPSPGTSGAPVIDLTSPVRNPQPPGVRPPPSAPSVSTPSRACPPAWNTGGHVTPVAYRSRHPSSPFSSPIYPSSGVSSTATPRRQGQATDDVTDIDLTSDPGDDLALTSPDKLTSEVRHHFQGDLP